MCNTDLEKMFARTQKGDRLSVEQAASASVSPRMKSSSIVRNASIAQWNIADRSEPHVRRQGWSCHAYECPLTFKHKVAEQGNCDNRKELRLDRSVISVCAMANECRVLFCYPTARQMSTALVPPNANEFDITAFMATSVRAVPGT